MLPIRKNFFNDDLFNSVPDMFFGNLNPINMKTDLKEVDDHYEMEIEIPGIAKEDINISLEDGYLTVEGVRNIDKDEKTEKGYIRKERYSGKVIRSYYVGDVSEDSIKASYVDGVLKVTYPKAKKELPEAKKITIE